MTAVLSAGDQVMDDPLDVPGAVDRGQHLKVAQGVDHAPVCGHVAGPEARRKRFGERADVDNALKLVQGGQAHAGWREHVRKRVALDDEQIVHRCDPQEAVRHRHGDRASRRIVLRATV